MASCTQARDDFPALKQRIHGKPLVFLDSAASALKPQVVVDRLTRYYANEHSNIHRGAYLLSQQATEYFENARRYIAQYLNAAHTHEIIFTRGTTEAINLVADSYGRSHIGAGDEILVTGMEHHSNMVPWHMICQENGATLKVLPVDEHGGLEMEHLETLLTSRTKLVAVTHISNALGTIVPIQDLVAAAHAYEVPVLVDGAQSAPHCKIDMQELGCDFFALSGHKVYGPTGIGVLYGRETLLDAMPPWQGGGDMIQTVTYDSYTHDQLPHKFEAGTPHIAGVIGLATALEYLETIGLENITAHESDLLEYAHQRLTDLGCVRLIGTAKPKAGVISFLVEDAHHYDVGKLLDEQGIAVRVGHHCAMPLMLRLNIPGTVRASLGLYNTREDIDHLAEGIRHAREKICGITSRAYHAPSSNGSFQDRERAILEDFALFDSADEKREYLMELGDNLPPYLEDYRTEEHRIHGCQSMVWLHTDRDGNSLHFMADSDALITKGMIALIVHLVDGMTPQDICDLDLDSTIARIGLPSLLTARRKNGLASMAARIKHDAILHGACNH